MMRQARRKKKKPIWGFGLAAFLIPVLIMFFVYLSLGIYWGSARSILASDAFSQFSNFHASFNNAMHGKQSFLYSWNASLGLNFWSLISYYLGGIFTPIVFFFNNENIPDVLYLLTLLKIGSAGLAFWFYGKSTFKIQQWSVLALSICYALMSFITTQSELIMWLDAFIYLPLIILGINRIFEGKKPIVLFISYLILFISNFYFGFMIGVFSVIYFFIKCLLEKGSFKKVVFPYFFTAFAAGISSMIMILPSVLDLRSNGETLSNLAKLKTEGTGFWDLVIKNMIGVYDTTKYGSIPFIYVGLLPLIFCIFYFITKKIPLKNKIAYGAFLGLFIASFYLNPLNLFWHGFHFPNMFLFRFSFLFSFLVLMLAGYGWEQFTKEDGIYFIGIGVILGVLFVLAKVTTPPENYDYVKYEAVLLSILFLVLYILIMSLYQQNKFLTRHLAILLFFLMSGEAFLNTNFMLNGILDDWNYASRSLYSKPYPSINALVTRAEKQNDEKFYRIDSIDGVSANDGFNYGYSGVSMFSSIRNRHSSSLLSTLGFRSRGTNLNIRYQNNTLLMDSLLGIKHNITKEKINKYGFDLVESKGDYKLYENQLALPLGMLTDKGIYEVALPETDNLTAQTNLLNQLSDFNTSYYNFIKPNLIKTENTKIIPDGKNKVMYQEEKANIGKTLTFDVFIPGGQQAYISIFPTDFGKLENSSVSVTTQGRTQKSQLSITGQYYDLGYFEKDSTVRFSLEFYGTKEINLIEPTVVTMDVNRYTSSIKQIQNKGIDFEVSNRKATAHVNLPEKQVLFTTIPFDKGWSVSIDGKKIATKDFHDGFLTFEVPKGKHDIKLSYLPPGFIIGVVCFFGGLTSFIVYLFYTEKQRKKQLLSHSQNQRRSRRL